MKSARILSTGILSLLALFTARSVHGQAISLTGTGGVYAQNFNTVGAGTFNNNSTLLGWYAQTDARPGSIPIALYDQGRDDNPSGFFAMGTTGERSLGFRPTTDTYSVTALGVSFRNTSASEMRIQQIGYNGEFYRSADALVADGYQFFYQKSTVAPTASPLGPFTSNNGGTYATNAAIADPGWTRIGDLDYAVTTAVANTKYAPPQVSDIAATLENLTLLPGEYITFRWRNPNDGSGDAMMSIDNFALSYVVPGSDIVYNLTHTAGGAPNGVLAANANPYWLKNGSPSGFTAGDRIIFSQAGTATISVPADVAVDRVSVTAASGTYTIGGAGRIFGDLVKSGNSSLVLTSANSFSKVNFDGGTLAGLAPGALNSVRFILGTDATLQLTGDSSLREIAGTGSLTKTGTGALVMTGSQANSYTGDTIIAGGTIVASKPANIAAIPGNLFILPGGAFKYAPGNGGQQLGTDATVTLTGGGSFGETAANPTTTGSPQTLSNVLNNGGTIGTGRALLSITQHYNQSAGQTTIHRDGTLAATQVTIGGTLNLEGSGTTPSRLNVGGTGLTLNSATVTLNSVGGSPGSIITLGGNVTTTGDTKILRSGLGAAQIDFAGFLRTFNVTGTLTFGEFAKPIDIANAGGGLLKTGPGTLNFFGPHVTTFPGGSPALSLTVLEGKMLINSNLSASSIEVNGFGTVFGGTGTINIPGIPTDQPELLLTNGATLEAGINGSGTFRTNKLTLGFAQGENVFVTVTRNTVPAIIEVTGNNGLRTNTFAEEVIINLAGVTPGVGEYILIDYVGSIQGQGFSAFKLGSLPSRLDAVLINDTAPAVTAIKLKVNGTDRPIWTGATSTAWTLTPIPGNKNWKLQSNGAQTDFMVGDQVLFDDTAVGPTPTVTIPTADVSPFSVTFANVNKTYTVGGPFGIAGSAALTKNEAGTVVMNASNSFTGGVFLNGGRFSVSQIGNIGESSGLGANGAITFDGGTLEYTGATATTDRLYSFQDKGGTLQILNRMTISSSLSGTAALTKTGLGALVLTGDNNLYNGGLIVNDGSIEVTDAIANLGSLGGSTQTVTLNNGGTLTDASTSPAEAFFSTASSILRSLAIGNGGGTINVVNAAHATVIEKADGISGSGAITKTGLGTLKAWGGTTTYSGHWIVNQGTLEVDSAINETTGVITSGLGTGTVEVNAGGTLAGRNNIVKNAIALTNGKLSTTGGDNTDYRGAVTAEGNFTVDLRDYTVPTTSRGLKISGVLGGAGAITVSGNAGSEKALILTNPNNTYAGTFLVQPSQTLQVVPSADGNPLHTATVQLTDATLSLRYDSGASNGVFAYGNNLIVLGTGTSKIEVNRADIDNGTSTGNAFRLGSLTMGAGTLSVVGGNGYRAEIGGSTTLSGAATFHTESADLVLKGSLSGNAGFTKTGAASLILEGSNTGLSGNLSIQEGTLVLRNSNLPNGNVNVTDGRLAGSGTITNSVNITSAGGAISPGETTPGILQINTNLTLAAGADFAVNVGGGVGNPIPGTTYDQVRIGTGIGAVSTGAVNINGSELLITLGTGIQMNNLFFLVMNDGTDAVNGTFFDLAQGQEFTVNGQGWRISYNANTLDGVTGTFLNTGNDIALMAVPEPGSVLLMLGGLGLIASTRRRRAR